MNAFFWGATAMASWAVGLIFFRSWRQTRDRLFALFGAAFWVLCAHWIALAMVEPATETRYYFYVIRLLAFILVLAAILDKNRS